MTAVLPDRSRWQGSSKISDEELRALAGLAARPGVTQVLEIGALHGFSTVAFAMTLEAGGSEGRVTTVDMFQKSGARDDERLFDANCAAYGVAGRIEKIKGFSNAPSVLAALEGRRFDLIFHDAEHTFRPVLRDLLNLEPLLAPGGFFALHDYLDKRDGEDWSLIEAVDLFFQGNDAYRFEGRTGSLVVFRKLRRCSPLRRASLMLRRALRVPAPPRQEAFR
jgi:predicted O-methyltransferase YrrM